MQLTIPVSLKIRAVLHIKVKPKVHKREKSNCKLLK